MVGTGRETWFRPSGVTCWALKNRRANSGFTLMEVLIVISIVAILLAMLLPALGAARESAHAVECLSNLRQWGLTTANYTADHRGHLPGEKNINNPSTGPDLGMWCHVLPPYAGAKRYHEVFDGSDDPEMFSGNNVWWCPTARIKYGPPAVTGGGNAFDYGFNAVLNGTGSKSPNLSQSQDYTAMSAIDDQSSVVLFSEPRSRIPIVYIGNLTKRHQGGANANLLYVDGHAGTIDAERGNTISTEGHVNDGAAPTVYKTADDELVWGVFDNRY